MSKRKPKQEAAQKAEAVKRLVLKREQCLQKITALQTEIEKNRVKIEEIDAQLSDLLDLNKRVGQEIKPDNPNFKIPQKGVVIHMAGVMSKEVPMTKDEINEAMKKKGLNFPINSIRSYLTNLQCFENIKKGDSQYNKKGWICHKEMINQS